MYGKVRKMSNMSYCRMQNTLRDLDSCVEALRDYGYDISSEELEAAREMVNSCKAFIEEMEQLDLR